MSYRLLPFHSKPHADLDLTRPHVAASIDPGLKDSFAVRVERRYGSSKAGPSISKPPRRLFFEVVDFGGKAATKAKKRGGANVLKLWGRVIAYLDSLAAILDLVNLFVLEHQISPNHAIDCLEQHVVSYLMTRYKDRAPYPQIVQVSPRLKTKLIPGPSGERLKGKALKKAAPGAAVGLLRKRGDFRSARAIEAAPKKDDLADTVLQLEAFYRLISAA